MSQGRCSILFLPFNIAVEGDSGETLDALALRGGVPLERPCTGAGICGKCRVRAAPPAEFLTPPTFTERRLLKKAELDAGLRLACCATILGSGTVSVVNPVGQRSHRILEDLGPDAMFVWDGARPGYGISVDIGTTTVACCLLDLQGQKILGVHSFLNPQIPFGDDVISRISHSTSSPEALGQLQRAILGGLSSAFLELAQRHGIRTEEIREVVVAANTVMEHLLMGVSPETIGKSPYTPAFFSHDPVPAASLGLPVHPEGLLKLIPNVAGYVGGDIVSGATAFGLDSGAPLKLLVDIGTNNEIVLGNRDGLYCCAAAAGPALEGARIQCGMRAQAGAIERVRLAGGELEIEVIGGGHPVGLCGSGLVDLLALLLREGIVERSGRFVPPEECRNEPLRSRLGRDGNGMVHFLLGEAADAVRLTQKDVREVQLALGAIRAGMGVLLERRDVSLEDIDELLLAGAFGNYIDLDSAMAVGLVPKLPRERIRSVKNASGLGACLALASPRFYEKTGEAAKTMQYIELSTLPDFQRRFVKAMIF